MVRIYNDSTIDIVTMLQQPEPVSIRITLKIYRNGTMGTGTPLAQRSLVVHNATISDYIQENSLALILFTLFTNGLPEINEWLQKNNLPANLQEKVAHYCSRALLQMRRLYVA